jgi:predicted signal transduction protein with EAL and GGDEF domain
MVMTQVEVQNMIGRIDASSGYPNQHQLFEDLGDLLLNHPGESRLGMMIEIVPSQHVSHGARVLGTTYAEELIRNCVPAIRRVLGKAVRVYQVGPTQLTVVLNESDLPSGRRLAEELEALLRNPVVCSGIPVVVDPAIGIYSFCLDDAAPRDVLRRLLSAVHDARSAGLPVEAYSRAQDEAHTRSFTILNDVQHALMRAEDFSLVYQPRIDLQTGQCVGAEALLRWQHPALGPVSPGEFVPLVEQTSLARLMTEWVLDAAISQIARWRRVRDLPRISINASAINLEETDFADRLAQVLERHKVPAAAIELEFTESTLARDKACVVNSLKRYAIMASLSPSMTSVPVTAISPTCSGFPPAC